MTNHLHKPTRGQEADEILAALKEIPDKDEMQVPSINRDTFIKVSELIELLETGNPLADPYLAHLRQSSQIKLKQSGIDEEGIKQDIEIQRRLALLKSFENPDETIIVTLEDGRKITVTELITLFEAKDPIGIECLRILRENDAKTQDQPLELEPDEQKIEELSFATRVKNFVVDWLKKLGIVGFTNKP